MNEFYNKMRYFEETEKKPAKIYYHYSSLDSLYNIVKSKTFRLTSLKSSNDKKELYYKPENFLSDLIKLCDKEKDTTLKNYFQIINNSINLNTDTFFKECKQVGFPYALCLSEKKDNLTHWDRYARQCTGVCIAFNSSAIDVYLQRMASECFGIGLYDIGKILYTSEQLENKIRNITLSFVEMIKRSSTIEKEITEILQDSGYIFAITIYRQTMKFTKDGSFIDEDEVRLLHDSISIKETLHLIDQMKSSIDSELYKNTKKNFIMLVNQLNIKNEQFYMSNDGIRAYKNFCLEEVWGSGTIPEIILGPLCSQNKKELRRFLKANGLEGTKISDSKVPIR